MSPRRWRLMFLLPLVLLTGALPLRPARAFDWAGSFDRQSRVLRESKHPAERLEALRLLSASPLSRFKPLLLAALGDPDLRVQLEAATLVTELQLLEATPLLIGWLTAGEPSLRQSAAATLGQLGPPQALQPLIRLLVDPQAEVRAQAAAALGKITSTKGREVIPLIRSLEDSSAQVRKAVVESLAKKHDPRTVIPLLRRLQDSSHEVRLSTVRALGQLGDPGAGPALVRMLQDPNHGVVNLAIDQLGMLRFKPATEALIDLLNSEQAGFRRRAALALGALGTPLGIETLVASLRIATLSETAKQALSAAGAAAAPQLVALLQDSRTPPAVALLAVEIIGAAKIRQAVPSLVEQLYLRRLPLVPLVQALGANGDPSTLRPLLELLDHPELELRQALLKALEPIVDERAAESLTRLLTDPREPIKLAAIRLLAQLKTRLATPPLLAIARDSTGPLALAAIAALAQSEDPHAVEPLISLLASTSRGKRRAVSQALAQAAPPAAAGQILALCRQSAPSIGVTCLQALGGVLRGSSDPDALRYLEQMLGGDDRSLFLAAVDALSAMQDPAIPLLLLERYPALDVRRKRKVLDALGTRSSHTTLRRVVPLLQKTLEDPEPSLRALAAWALSKLDGRAAAPDALRSLARERHWQVRLNAYAAVGRAPAAGDRTLLLAGARDSISYVRANALLGLARLADLRDRDIFLTLLKSDKSPWVRANALKGLLLLPWRPVQLSPGRVIKEAGELIRTIAREDPNPKTRQIASQLLSSPPRGTSWITLYLLNPQREPFRDGLFVLVTPSGMLKASYSDAMAESWEEDLQPGRCFIELPAQRVPFEAP